MGCVIVGQLSNFIDKEEVMPYAHWEYIGLVMVSRRSVTKHLANRTKCKMLNKEKK